MVEVKRHWSAYVLALIVLASCGLSMVWVFRVPLLQNPDESSHIDYVFSIYSANRLLNARRAPSAWNVHPRFEGRKDTQGPESNPYDLLSHQYTLYLIDATDFQRIRFHSDEKVPADYGTSVYYRNLYARAPKAPAALPDLQPRDNPWMVTAYPFLYYAVCAVFLKVASVFAGGPAGLFLSARVLSVILFGISLIIAYAILREQRLRAAHALMLTAIVAFFPLSIFVSASVQPDNLTFLLVLLCWLFALRLRRVQTTRLHLLLGLVLGALLVTKYHIFLLTAFAVLSTVLSEQLYRRRSVSVIARHLALLILPSVALFMVQLWVVWGGEQITGGNLHSASVGIIRGIRNAIYDYYRGGPPWVSWWGTFGWMDAPLVIWSPAFQARVTQSLLVLTSIMLLLILFRCIQLGGSLANLALRGRSLLALRLLFSNPLVINHLLFSVFMVLLYALTDNAFAAQGRHWFPYTLSGFFITTHFATSALTYRKARRILTWVLLASLLIYCAAGAYFSLKTITTRYYASEPL